MNTNKQTTTTASAQPENVRWNFTPQGTNQRAGGPRYRFGHKRASDCQCDYNYTCGDCMAAAGPTR